MIRADDCLAVRLADAFQTRFGAAAPHMAAIRLDRALQGRSIVKADLFTAVTVILDDHTGVFARSRGGR